MMCRLEAIAIDAELQEKSEADLKHLAEFLQNRVNEAMAEYTKTLHKDPTFESKQFICIFPTFINYRCIYNIDIYIYYFII